MYNQCHFFFDDGDFGWDEVYYDATNYTAIALEQLVATWNKAIPLAQKRQALLAAGQNPCNSALCSSPQLTGIRVSALGSGEGPSPRLSLFGNPNGQFVTNANGRLPWATNPNQGAGTNGGNLGPADNPYSGVEVIYTTVTGSQSKRNLAGVPRGVIADQALCTAQGVGGTWYGNFKAFAQQLIGTWGALAPVGPTTKVNPANTPNTWAIQQLGGTFNGIQYAPQNVIGQPTIQLSTPISFAAGSPFNACAFYLVIFGTKGLAGSQNINGVYRAIPLGLVYNPTPPQQPVLATPMFLLLRRFQPLNLLCLGWATAKVNTVNAFMDVQLDRPASRKRGVPTVRHRGRTRTRV